MTEQQIINSLTTKYGNPFPSPNMAWEIKNMMSWHLPPAITNMIPALGTKLYINKDIQAPLQTVLLTLIAKGLHEEIKTFNGCFNPRPQRGTTNVPSMHAFGYAIDMNAATNAEYQSGTDWTPDFIKVFTDNNWIWGGTFGAGREDPMHFEYTGLLFKQQLN